MQVRTLSFLLPSRKRSSCEMHHVQQSDFLAGASMHHLCWDGRWPYCVLPSWAKPRCCQRTGNSLYNLSVQLIATERCLTRTSLFAHAHAQDSTSRCTSATTRRRISKFRWLYQTTAMPSFLSARCSTATTCRQPCVLVVVVPVPAAARMHRAQQCLMWL